MMNRTRSYYTLRQLQTFTERFNYLRLSSAVGRETFGFDRYLNQRFYTSAEWRAVRNAVVVRDDGCDLGVKDCPIMSNIIVHHMNPISVDDFENFNPDILDPEYLICVSLDTHNSLHFGNDPRTSTRPIERKRGDTKLW